jgi:hydroxyethylthiazole kinase
MGGSLMNYGMFLDQVRKTSPLVHHLTNYVTVNDCANAALAIGASPVMADEPDEAAEMASFASAVVINIGTLNQYKMKAMLLAGETAHEKKLPVVFDPTGCGATRIRKEFSQQILNRIHPDLIKGNAAEILSLLGEAVKEKGVDSDVDCTTEAVREASKRLARMEKTIVVCTGAVDIVTDGTEVIQIANGCPEMGSITGTGCMLSTLCGAFIGACREDKLHAAAAAVMTMGIAGEMAYEKEYAHGLGHFHMGIMDALGHMTASDLEKRGHVETIR